MRQFSILFFFSLLSYIGNSQTDEDRTKIIKVVDTMFDAMRNSDSASLRQIFHPNIRMRTYFIDKEGQSQMKEDDEEKFIAAVGKPKTEIWDEKIWSYDVNIDGNMATVWTDYTFFLGKKQLHCGINTFELFKNQTGWSITAISDTRRKTDCLQNNLDSLSVQQIHQLMDAWHQAAATADEVTFFGSMAPNCIYLGTDASEKWLRDELKSWSKKYFARDTAWAFKPFDRHIYLGKDHQIAWFEEKLDTWMGECRGSGVLEKTINGWKLSHYNLAVTIDNDKIEGFIDLGKKD